MTGAEHYAEAERILGVAWDHVEYGEPSEALQEAQAHATLALFDSLREIGDQLDTMPRHDVRRKIRRVSRSAAGRTGSMS